jgi:regulator of replication initiation timing
MGFSDDFYSSESDLTQQIKKLTTENAALVKERNALLELNGLPKGEVACNDIQQVVQAHALANIKLRKERDNLKREYDYEHNVNIGLAQERDRLREALGNLIKAMPEPQKVSMGFDSPPEFATQEDFELGHALYEAKAALQGAEEK